MLFYLVTSFFLRIILLLHPITKFSFDFVDTIKIFIFGFTSDFFVFIIASAFLWVYLIFISNSKYLKPWGYIIFGFLVVLMMYLSFGNTILNEYGGVVPKIVIGFITLKTILFGLLLFIPKYRATIRFWLYSFTIFIYVLLILQNAISEYFFWNEFGVRYNFIAVDYLVYTNEVIGNIMQSYPVIPIFTSLFIITFGFSFLIIRYSKSYLDSLPDLSEKLKSGSAYIFLFALSFFMVPFLSSKESSTNLFANELQSNGIYKFYSAFLNNELDYFKFYKTLSQEKASLILNKQIQNIGDQNIPFESNKNPVENHKNVVLITIESESAEFMKEYGNEMNITPFLDDLATKSLLFTNFYAVGNRTVRGLEAVTLCLPPTAGESVIKRTDNKNKYSTGHLFAQRNYSVKFMYGGDAFFDNMDDFFSGNGYDIVDKKSFKPNEISFSNVWGVCDEDMAQKAIKIMNEESRLKKPFFNHWMTVSNHRPFTYPEGKIKLLDEPKTRNGGVKYTDYALKMFFEMASKQPWFKNTVFVILADHCASSSGNTELPLDKYRIPAMIYSPGFVEPQKYNKLMSQIDLMPTLFGLLNFNYQSKFFGQDVLKPNYKPRAFIATYEDLGLIKDNVLTVLSPKKQVKQYQLKSIINPRLKPEFQLFYSQSLLTKERTDLVSETISYYQTASDLLKKRKYQL